MKLTVAVISKDREEQLVKCFRSISLQTRVPDQLVLVEDTSDNKYFDKKRIKSFFTKNIEILYIETNVKNISDSRNICLDNTTGNITVLMDNDIILPTDYLSKVEEKHRNNKDVFAYVGKIYPQGKNLMSKYQSYLFMGEQRFLKFDKPVANFPCPILSFKTDVVRKYGYKYNNFFEAAEEIDFLLSFTEIGEVTVFSPSLKIYHNFRSDLSGFIKRHIEYGRVLPKYKNKYPNYFYVRPYKFLNIFMIIKESMRDIKKYRISYKYLFLSFVHHLCILIGVNQYKKFKNNFEIG